MGKQDRPQRSAHPDVPPSGLTGASEADRVFLEKLKRLPCPGCGLEFTDFALEWGDAWLEGRMDLLIKEGWKERDGPYKVKCEHCGHRSWINYFDWTATSAEDGPSRSG